MPKIPIAVGTLAAAPYHVSIDICIKSISTYQSMKSTKQVECNLSRNKSIDDTTNRNPEGPQDKDKSLAVDVCYSSPE